MLIIDSSMKYYIIDDNGDYAEVHQFNIDNLTVGHYYEVNDICYKYIGTIYKLHNIPDGIIAKFNGNIILNEYGDPQKEKSFSINNVVSEDDLTNTSIDDVLRSYCTRFNNSTVVEDAYIRASGGDILMPDINEDDDPFMIAIKMVIRNRGNVIISRYRDRFKEPHAIDNLRTTVLGATRNMSIDRFLIWCEILSIDWTLSLTDNGQDKLHPMTTDIKLSNKTYDSVEVLYPVNTGRGYFTPIYETGEDPLKRALKCAINSKNIKLKDYMSLLPTTHMLSNMRSSIMKSANHTVSVPYFISWCEILGISHTITIYDPDREFKFSIVDGSLIK